MGWATRRPRWLCVLLVGAMCIAGTDGSRAWQPGQYPNPIKSPEACGRGESLGWICDPDHVLEKEEADSISSLLQSISSATPPYPPVLDCPKQGHDGFPVAVAVLKTLGSRFGRPKKVEAHYFAEAVYNAWQMEQKDCHNGLLLVIASEDREAHMKVGVGLYPVLSTSRMDSIMQSAKKRMAAGDVSGAIQGAMQEAVLSLVNLQPPAPVQDQRQGWGLSLFSFGFAGIAFMGVLRCWMWLGKRHTRRTLA